jgi:hypothetical protein
VDDSREPGGFEEATVQGSVPGKEGYSIDYPWPDLAKAKPYGFRKNHSCLKPMACNAWLLTRIQKGTI